MTLTVLLTRSKNTRNLAARVVQKSAQGTVLGRNVLANRRIRRIETAKTAARAELFNGDPSHSILWDIQAAPDLQPPYPKSATRTELRKELTS